jgi:tRNA(adenine34) deaminase
MTDFPLTISTTTDLYDSTFMKKALEIAEEAPKGKGQFPIGAVIVLNGKIIAQAFSKDKHTHRPGDHAERLVIDEASARLKGRMNGCTLYTTAEPCQRCISTLFQAGIHEVVFAAYRKNLPMREKGITLEHLVADASYTPKITGGCLEDAALELFTKRGFKVQKKKS